MLNVGVCKTSLSWLNSRQYLHGGCRLMVRIPCCDLGDVSSILTVHPNARIAQWPELLIWIFNFIYIYISINLKEVCIC